MDLRTQLTVVRRHWFVIILAIVVAAAVAALVGRNPTTTYKSQAQVLLMPGDPAESITPAAPPADITSYAQTQAQLVTTPAVADQVAAKLHGNASSLAGEVSVQGTNILYITATDRNAARAQSIAQDFAVGYLQYSRQTAVTALHRTAAVLKTQSGKLLAQLQSHTVPSGSRAVVRGQARSLYAQYVTATINASLARGNAKLLAAAPLATGSNGTPLAETVGFGAIAGLLIGLAGAFLREQLDERIRSRDEVERISGLPVLAEAPFSRRALRTIRKDGLEPAMLTELGETGRALRTAVMFHTVRQEERRILITSPGHGDGKTLASTLLAAAYAQAGFRTVLISADLRRPGAEELLGRSGSSRQGLTDALLLQPHTESSNGVGPHGEVARYVEPTGVPNLSHLARGSIRPNPGDLLGSPRMDDLLDELARSFDMLIIDSAPLLPVADTRALVEKVDGVLLVVTAGQNRRGIARAMDTLRPAEVPWLGLVFNRAPVGTPVTPLPPPPPPPAVEKAARRRHAYDSAPSDRSRTTSRRGTS
jgi:succinoglycan biosynthesis transport protein ExoP